jgi:hypothetical protein
MFPKAIFLFPALALASITIEDPEDVINPAFWKADNAIVPDYDIAMISTQPSDSKCAIEVFVSMTWC